MDKTILLMTVGIIIEIIVIIFFLKKNQNKAFLRFRVLFAIFFGIMASFQIYTIGSMFMMEGVFEPHSQFTKKSSIQNPSSQALIPLVKKQDFPENWEWISETVQQPSKFPWKGSPSDAAESILIAKVSHLLIFRHYVRVFNWSAFYESPISEQDFNNRISHSSDETSFTPTVNRAGKYFFTTCSKGSNFYVCDISIGYEHVISSLLIETPQELGEEFTIDLINSSIESIEQKVK
jgi:hypothetical protein